MTEKQYLCLHQGIENIVNILKKQEVYYESSKNAITFHGNCHRVFRVGVDRICYYRRCRSSLFGNLDTGAYTASTVEQIEDGTGTKYTMNDSGICYVRNMGGEHKNAAWLPGVYHNNFDRSPALSYTESTGHITASADYYIDHPKDATTGAYIDEAFHFAIRTTNGASFVTDQGNTSGNLAFATIRRYAGDDNYYLFLDTAKSGGWISYNGSITYVNAEGFVKIQPNTWFTIVIDFNLKTGFYTLTYRDADRDVVLGSARVGLTSSTTGMQNIKLPANSFSMGYVVSSAGATDPTSHVSVCMDNVRIDYTEPETADASVELLNDFEDYSDQKSLMTSNFNYAFSAAAPYYKVLSETVSGADNQFLRVPFLYGGDSISSGTTNYDKPFTIKHAAFDSTNGRYMIYEADFRFKQSETKANLQLQLNAFDFEDASGNTYNGRYLALFDINLQTGDIGGNGAITKTGAASLAANEWTRVKLVIDLEEGAYRIYVNGVTYGYYDSMNGMYSSGGWKTVSNIKNIKVSSNNLIVAKIYNSYTVAESWSHVDDADDTYSNVNHMDIDNIRLETTDTEPSIVLPPVTAENDFEGYSDKQSLTTNDAFTVQTYYNKVLTDESNNKFLRVPFLYGGDSLSSGTTNYDKPFTLKHAAFDSTNGRYMIYEADFRFKPSATKASVQLQLNAFDFEDASGNTYNGRYLALFDINLQTGAIRGNSEKIILTGAAGLAANEWARIKYVLDLENGSYRIYVNGVTYGYYDSMNGMYSSGGWKTVSNIKNIKVSSNNLIVAKIYNSYTVAESWSHADAADDTYSNVNHMDIDNIRLETTNTEPAIVLPPIDALEDFENGTSGSALSSSNSSTTTAYNKVLSETVEGNANQFLRVPLLYDGTGDHLIGTDGYTNYDKTVTMKHSKISTEVGKYAVFTVDYRPHAEANASTGTIEVQITNYKFDALVENASQKSTAPRGSTYAKLIPNK
ncbi:MAG: hypothetical protein E7643_08655 [Ruminococcaceae bacterium]|nr:hypothetical protein [Oscillospiraceae bacterium]